MVGQVGAAQLVQPLPGDEALVDVADGAVVVHEDDVMDLLVELGQLEDLLRLGPVLGHDDDRLGVAQDEQLIRRLGVGVDGRRGAPRAGHAEVGEDPLDARHRRNGHALLTPQPERDEARGDLVDLALGLAPGHVHPPLGLGVERHPVGHGVRCGCCAGPEHRRVARLALGEDPFANISHEAAFRRVRP